ncbi:MAG: tetratricopeptide repeat protein, partial [Actinomycetota bacterium]|nr:tetratricopeptide repeat protein [Actinomycetota bacterium]
AIAGDLLAGLPAGDTAGTVRDLERRVAADGRNAEALTLLGLAYQQRARETADSSFYGRSEAALRRALELVPRDPIALTGVAALAASRHRFHVALRLARRVIATRPRGPVAYGILGDSLVELGRYREAFAAFDRMAELKPSLSSYARIAYARELLGDTSGALAAMRLAVEAGSAVPEHSAWALVQLGNLHFDSGRPLAAGRAYRDALARLPGYPYAEAGLARVEAARGRLDQAVARLRRVVARTPFPEFAVRLAETLGAAGREREAREAARLVDAIERVLEANGVRTELETALFDLDHARNVASALARAREAHARAPSVRADDVLAWALFRVGRCREARLQSKRALRLGTRDALMHFHRGLIERCLGHRVAAQRFLRSALAINAYFSPIYARIAKEALG